jgi:hypothetical protein
MISMYDPCGPVVVKETPGTVEAFAAVGFVAAFVAAWSSAAVEALAVCGAVHSIQETASFLAVGQ